MRGFELLPRTYRLTVEDKRRGVDLVPLHRALLGMDGVRDMSLLSYSNGTAIVALETTVELIPTSSRKPCRALWRGTSRSKYTMSKRWLSSWQRIRHRDALALDQER